MSRLRLFAPLLLCLTTPSTQLAQSSDGENLIDSVRQAVLDRVAKQNPVWIKYRMNFTETPVWQGWMQYKKKSDSDIQFSCEAEYARKGTKFRSWVIFHGRPGVPSGEPSYILFNGQTQVKKGYPFTP